MSEQAEGEQPHDDIELPEGALFWRWAGKATRPVAGWVLIGVGALAIVLGYLGVAREVLVARQIPYLVSGGIGGMVLVAVGAFFLGTEDLRKELSRLDRMETQLGELHELLLEPVPGADPNGATDASDEQPTGPTRRRRSSASA